MYKIGEDEMVICPYNRYHIVSKLRIQRHIVKCKKNHPDVKLATCFYNYCHRLKPEAILEHYEICSHKTRMEGARYDLDCYTSYKSSVKPNIQSSAFPNINVKPKFFSNFSSASSQVSCEDIHKLDSSECECEDCHSVMTEKNRLQFDIFDEENAKDNDGNSDGTDEVTYGNDFKEDNCDDDDDDDDDDYDDDDDSPEPLPLPKTISKAFVCVKSNPLTCGSSETSKNKVFGRGKILLASSEKSRTTDHLLPDLSSVQINSPKKEEKCRFFLRSASNSCSASITSSMFDDTSTLKSEEILNKDIYDEDNSFILKNFDTYIEI